MPRKRVTEAEHQPFEATTYPVIAEEPIPVPLRLEQLAQEIGQLFSGGPKTWSVRKGNVTIKVKVWEAAN